MEAPVPVFYTSTPGNLNDSNNNNNNNNSNDNNIVTFSKSTELKIKYENINITLIIGIGSDKENLFIQAKKEGVLTYYFERKYSVSELIEIDKVFKQCDNMEEAYNSMIIILKNDNNSIKEINDDKLIISIHILNLDSSYREKVIELKKKRQSQDNIIENLCQQIMQLKTNNTNLENELNDVKKRLEKIEEQLNNKKSLIDSNILKDKKDIEFIINRLKKVNLNEGNNIINEENIVLNLIYRGSRDGDKAKDFHNKCDKYKNNLTIIKTKNGLRFGGFTCESWEGKGDKKDINAFCFSLDKYKIYNYKKGKTSIYTCPNSGPVFGNCVFEINDCYFENGGLSSEDYFYDNQQYKCEINDGKEQFEVKEIEVFKVIF